MILNKFLSIPEVTESRKAKIPINSIDITERFLFSILNTSFIQQIVERACESILVLIGSDGLPPVISSNFFWFKSEEFQHKFYILSLKMKWIYSLWQLMHLLHTHAYIYIHIYMYTYIYIYIYIYMQLTVWGRGGYPYFAMYHYYITVLLYNILLYILFFKIATFFPKFNFHWYSS